MLHFGLRPKYQTKSLHLLLKQTRHVRVPAMPRCRYTWGVSAVISMPAGFRRHLVGKTLVNVRHCDIAEIRFVGELVIVQTFS